ncbi:MAG TPA: 5-formyltetrahydrofolate cyclo-ligase [Rhizomicrobium sp.]|jgi:5-formyltetrahydrofolate cyclo-ligase
MNSEPPIDVREWRKRERARLIDERKAMSPDEHRAASDVLHRSLLKRLPPDSQDMVGCYWPFRREFNCVPYMRDVLRCGGRVALPVVLGRGKPLEFRCWTENAEMEQGVWNIPHPAQGPAVMPAVLVIPLVGFDAAGFRLGYGAGYYDMTLAAHSERPLAVGIGFEFSCLPTIYPQSHDLPMDVIVTDQGVREIAVTTGA